VGRLSLLFSTRRQDFEFRFTESISTSHGHGQITPKPFVWTKNPNKIIAAVKRGFHVLDSIH
jgi:hypothetical protein